MSQTVQRYRGHRVSMSQTVQRYRGHRVSMSQTVQRYRGHRVSMSQTISRSQGIDESNGTTISMSWSIDDNIENESKDENSEIGDNPVRLAVSNTATGVVRSTKMLFETKHNSVEKTPPHGSREGYNLQGSRMGVLFARKLDGGIICKEAGWGVLFARKPDGVIICKEAGRGYNLQGSREGL